MVEKLIFEVAQRADPSSGDEEPSPGDEEPSPKGLRRERAFVNNGCCTVLGRATSRCSEDIGRSSLGPVLGLVSGHN